MAYRVTHKVFSLKNPGKIYQSCEEFWIDHGEEDVEVDAILDALEDQGKLIENADELSEDGTYVIYTKTFDSEETYDQYISNNSQIIDDNNYTYDMVPIFKGNVDI
jgi:hypothetical protein